MNVIPVCLTSLIHSSQLIASQNNTARMELLFWSVGFTYRYCWFSSQ